MAIKKAYLYPIIMLTVGLIGYTIGLRADQVASLIIFTSLISGTLLFWRYRLAFALIGIAALLAIGLLNTDTLVENSGLDIILFLMGMMIVIGYLEERHFFEYLLGKILAHIDNNPQRLIILLMLLSALFAALVDEVTSILFMMATVLRLTSKLQVNPLPFVIIIVFATNIGSSATVIGNPVSVLIAIRADLAFMEFLRWATPISIAALMVAIPISLKYFSGDIKNLGVAMTQRTDINSNSKNGHQIDISNDGKKQNSSSKAITKTESDNNQKHKISWILFLGTIAGLILHSVIEDTFGLQKNILLIGTSLGAGGVTLLIYRHKARPLVERRVDWWTLAFFILLFASVGTLRITGITDLIAEGIFELSGGEEIRTFFLFSIFAGITSAFMDNIIGVATFIPVVEDATELGINEYPLWWGLLFAGTLFGNLTLIGSTANIVALGILEKQKGKFITLTEWIKPGIMVSVPTLILALILLYIQIPLMPNN